jgi:hypothetical protein
MFQNHPANRVRGSGQERPHRLTPEKKAPRYAIPTPAKAPAKQFPTTLLSHHRIQQHLVPVISKTPHHNNAIVSLYNADCRIKIPNLVPLFRVRIELFISDSFHPSFSVHSLSGVLILNITPTINL